MDDYAVLELFAENIRNDVVAHAAATSQEGDDIDAFQRFFMEFLKNNPDLFWQELITDCGSARGFVFSKSAEGLAEGVAMFIPVVSRVTGLRYRPVTRH